MLRDNFYRSIMITLFRQRHTLICKGGFIFLAALDAFGSPTAKITISNACESSLAPSKSRQPCLNRLFSHYHRVSACPDLHHSIQKDRNIRDKLITQRPISKLFLGVGEKLQPTRVVFSSAKSTTKRAAVDPTETVFESNKTPT